jgi:acetate kinase
MKVLVINVGSTSLKFRLFDMPAERELASGRVERVGSAESPCRVRLGAGPEQHGASVCPNQRAAITWAIEALTGTEGVLQSLNDLDAVGFKPVHARGIAASVVVTDDVIAAMEDYTPLAPVHNPPYIEAFRIARELMPATPLVGVFEPAFHSTIPEHARTYAIPYEWTERHAIRRYGFHGASHRYMSERVPELVGRPREGLRIISCHLGGSSSLCAIRDGVSVDTSMGFSPQSGLPNANRSGDLDPFIILYLQARDGLSGQQISDALVKNGGLKGISGLSGDVRDLEKAASEGNRRAALALDVLVYEARKYVGAYAAVLGGLDVLAFTGGIGENATAVRARICEGLAFLGVELDGERNRVTGKDAVLSAPGSPVTVAAVLANEELVIARETVKTVRRR